MSRTPRARFASAPTVNDQHQPATVAAGAVRKRTTGRRAKYGNVRVMIDGEVIDSKKEAKRWRQLQLLELHGHITDLKRQVAFELAPRAVFKKSRASPAIRYVADFAYYENGQYIVEDTKSPISRKLPVFRLKRHLMQTVHGLEIRES
jgi:hypothetical protein